MEPNDIVITHTGETNFIDILPVFYNSGHCLDVAVHNFVPNYFWSRGFILVILVIKYAVKLFSTSFWPYQLILKSL